MFFVSGTRFFNERGEVLSGDTFKSGVLVQKNLPGIGKNYLQVHSKSVTHNRRFSGESPEKTRFVF